MRRLLYFTADDHYLYSASGGKLELEAKFTGDDLGVSAFRDYLKDRRGALFSVIADLAGEDFHEEQVPFVRGADREAIVQRRLAQRYRDTRLATALSLGAVQTPQRRNERLLLASFTNTQQFAPWLDALEEADTRLAGVYSVPLLAPALAARLGARSARTLIVTANRAGLRQCYVEGGRLRFARLERTIEMAPQALAAFVRSETLRLAQYLATLRVLPRDGSQLPALVVAPPGERAVFEQTLVSDARVLFQTVDHAQARRAVRLRQAPQGMGSEALYLQLAARKAPREQFASRGDRRRFEVWRLQRGLVAAGLIGLAACVVFAGARWLETAQLNVSAAEHQIEAARATERYQRITAAFPVTETTTENLRATVLEFRRIAEASPQPESALAHISRVLQQFPQIELQAVNWRVGRSEKREADTADGLEVVLSGRVNATQRSDYRGLTAQVQRFAGALASGGYQLVGTQLPFDITSAGTLTGDIGGGRDTGEAPRFTITLGRKLP